MKPTSRKYGGLHSEGKVT